MKSLPVLKQTFVLKNIIELFLKTIIKNYFPITICKSLFLRAFNKQAIRHCFSHFQDASNLPIENNLNSKMSMLFTFENENILFKNCFCFWIKMLLWQRMQEELFDSLFFYSLFWIVASGPLNSPQIINLARCFWIRL